jgi:hypothetical protein
MRRQRVGPSSLWKGRPWLTIMQDQGYQRPLLGRVPLPLAVLGKPQPAAVELPAGRAQA